MKIKQIFSLLNGFLILIMVILSIVLFISIASLKEDIAWVTHTYEAINKAEVLLSNMIDQETGMRGFLATGNSEYLTPYEIGGSEFDLNIEELKNTVNDNPLQVVKLVEIQRLSDQWHKEASDYYISIKKEILDSKDIVNELHRLTTSGAGKEKMDKIRLLLKDINDESIRLNILNSMINMETGVRAYIINRAENYLEPYYEGKSTIYDYLTVADDKRINYAVEDWINNIGEKEIELVKKSTKYKTEQDLHDAISLGVGKLIMDQIRSEVATFISVEEDLLTKRIEASDKQFNLAIISILIALTMIIFMAIIQRIATNKVTEPLIVFSQQMKEFDPTNIDEDIIFDQRVAAEIVDLGKGYGKLLKQLKLNLNAREETAWVQESQMEISSISENHNEINSLLNHLIACLTVKLNGQYGAIYLLDESEKENKYMLKAAYAIDDLEIMGRPYGLGEGLIGQVAIEKEVLTVTEVPANHIKISTGLGKSTPQNLVIIPCIFDDKVIAIIEIASLSKFSDLMMDFIKKSQASIGIIISNSMTKDEVQNLLEKTKEANEKLRMQQEELRVSNEELETQSTSLMEAQSELEAQQMNLKVANEELEANAASLKEQKKNLEEKNRDLELSKAKVAEKTEDLIKANKYKSEFLANMSHELRTPLNSILILSELLGESEDIKSENLKYANTINSSGKSLLALINDILDLSKVEAGQVEMDIARLNLLEFKNEIINLFEQLSIKKKLKFNVNVSEELPEYIMTDELKLKQIVNNLLSNSFKFTESGGVDLNLRLKENKIEFEVVDTGIGISEDKIDLIFGAFKQEDGSTSRKFGGTGLGLSISTEYAKMLGGKIEVSSIKGEGSKFILSIPMAIDHNELAVVESTDSNKDVLSNPLNEVEVTIEPVETDYIADDRKHIREEDKVILIIDDDPTFATIVMGICKSNGFKVIIAESGESGLYLADYYGPTAIILDIGLPGIDGLQVVDKLKANKRTRNIPINIVSGKDIEDKVISAGIEFYKKPVGKSHIEKMLSESSLKDNKINKIITFGLSDLVQSSLIDLSNMNNKALEIIECLSELEVFDVLKEEFADLIVFDMELITEKEISFIKKIKEKSINKDLSVIIYTGDIITESDERRLRSQVSDIIIKEGNSTQRLINEIKIFVHNVKENKTNSINNGLDSDEFNGKVVLLVDDDMRNIFAVSSILQKLGIVVEMANDGKEAIETLERLDRVDLVLMDIMMPVMDGYEAMETIRTMEKYKSIPIIALTAKAMKGDKDICIKAGASEYLSKPIDKNKLLSILRVWI